jgi:hypothetical protein
LGVSDERSAIHYVRTTPDGRIAFGIGGMQPDLARHIDPRFGYDEASIRVAVDDLHRMFPSFADVPRVATCTSASGSRATAWDRPISAGGSSAHRVLAKYDDVLALPLVDLEPRRFPPEPIRSVGRW